jgi:hypothetical protein
MRAPNTSAPLVPSKARALVVALVVAVAVILALLQVGLPLLQHFDACDYPCRFSPSSCYVPLLFLAPSLLYCLPPYVPEHSWTK